MKNFLLVILLLCLGFGSTAWQREGAPAVNVTAQSVDSGLYILDSKWRFILADDSVFARPDYVDTAWGNVISAFREKEIKHHKPDRAAWFRKMLWADSTIINKPVVIQLTGNGAASIFLDGKLLRRIGKQKDNSGGEYLQLAKFPAYLSFDTAGMHTLAIRYENIGYEEFEDDWGFTLSLNTPENILQNRISNIVYPLAFLLPVGSLFFTLFLIHLLIFLFYRKEIFNLYFALFCVSIAIVLFILAYIMQSDKSLQYHTKLIYCLPVCSVVGFYAISSFCTRLFSKGNFVYYSIIVLSVLNILLLFITDPQADYASFGLLLLGALSIGYSLVLIIKAIITKKKGASVLGFGILFFFAFILLIVLLAIANDGYVVAKVDQVSGVLLNVSGVLAIFSIPISISSYLAWRFADTNKNLEHQLMQVETLSAQQLLSEKEKQNILENQKEELEREVVVRTEDLTREKKKSDDLLLNILPHEIAEELKSTGQSKAHQYDEVSVLFTDFVNFTQISEKLGVDELLEELNINFTAFDRIMDKYGLEKIKTIGDAYLAVSGLPMANEQHAQNAVRAALDIIQFVQERKKQVVYGLDIRIGINSGSLIAGIIGVKKFAYDIWGDTVNIAARMEQSSAPGKVNVSEPTYQLIKTDFDCTHRGKIDAKHKGEMDMYFVTGINKDNI